MATILLSALILLIAAPVLGEELYSMPKNVETRWASFENPSGAKGQGGMTNQGAKGAAFDTIAAGETRTLMEATGPGTIRRIWCTLSNRDPKSLRAYVLRFYWDGAERPAVEVPLGDFFGAVLGKMTAYESELFSSPEGRSLCCFVPMPFRTAAKVTFTNESDTDLPQLFYDVDYTLGDAHPADTLYFHATWRRDPSTTLGKDFEILPILTGHGRFLGAHIGILGHPDNIGWFGEGEVKMYLDGDADGPTLVGTGTEDYIGTAYGQGVFANRWQGCWIMDNAKRQWTFYRYHIPDPIYFQQDIRVTIQQMGGSGKKSVVELLKKGVEVRPVSAHTPGAFVPLMDKTVTADTLPNLGGPDAWTNMYRRDDVCATALFYLDRPENGLPPIAPLTERVMGIEDTAKRPEK